MDLYLNVRYINAFDMKRLLLVIFISIISWSMWRKKTCPTYSFNDLNTEQQLNTEDQSV